MAFSQTDVTTLRAAIATGAKRVRFGAGPDSREVEYRSLAEMRSVLSEMEASLAGPAHGPVVSFAEYKRD